MTSLHIAPQALAHLHDKVNLEKLLIYDGFCIFTDSIYLYIMIEMCIYVYIPFVHSSLPEL